MISNVNFGVITGNSLYAMTQESYDEVIVKTVKTPFICFFDTPGTYKQFLARLDTSSLSTDLITRAKNIFDKFFGPKYEMVELINDKYDSVILPKLLLIERFPFFKDVRPVYSCNNLSLKSLKIVEAYIFDDINWNFDTIELLEEIFRWSELVKDEKFTEIVEYKISQVLSESNNERFFKEKYFKTKPNFFVEQFLYKRNIKVDRFDAFINLFKQEDLAPILKFIAKHPPFSILEISSKCDFKAFSSLPSEYREVVKGFYYSGNDFSLKTLAFLKKVHHLFPTRPIQVDNLNHLLESSDLNEFLIGNFIVQSNPLNPLSLRLSCHLRLLLKGSARVLRDEIDCVQNILIEDVQNRHRHFSDEEKRLSQQAVDNLGEPNNINSKSSNFMKRYANEYFIRSILFNDSHQEAIDNYYRAFELNKEDSSILKNLIRAVEVLCKFLQENDRLEECFQAYEKAEALFLRLSEVNPNSYSVLEGLGKIQLNVCSLLKNSNREEEGHKKFIESQLTYLEAYKCHPEGFEDVKLFAFGISLQACLLKNSKMAYELHLLAANFYLEAHKTAPKDFEIIRGLAVSFVKQAGYLNSIHKIDEANEKYQTIKMYLERYDEFCPVEKKESLNELLSGIREKLKYRTLRMERPSDSEDDEAVEMPKQQKRARDFENKEAEEPASKKFKNSAEDIL